MDLSAAINVVTKKQVVRIRWKPAELEHAKQIVVLAMNIT